MKAIVVGAGKSFYDQYVIEQIAKSNYDGHIVLSDKIAKEAIQRGINPIKNSVSIVTQEEMTKENRYIFRDFYINPEVHSNRKYVRVFLSGVIDPLFAIAIYQDFEFVNMFRRKYKKNPMCTDKEFAPTIKTCGNVGAACFNVARTMLGCDQIALLGLDFDIPELKVEYDLTLTELRSAKDVSIFNLSCYGKIDSDNILRCSFQHFLKDDYLTAKINHGIVNFP